MPPVDAATAVVVATQGEDDEAALHRAPRTHAGYVGLVVSRKRAAATPGYLHGRRVPETDLARVQAPAGLDLGSTPAAEAIDSVCGMTVDVASARWQTEHDGRTWYFCSFGCLQAFTADPSVFNCADRLTRP